MSHNTWIHRIVRPLVVPLVGTSVSPNHLTTLRLAFGVATAAAYAAGDPDWRDVGGALFIVAMLLDRADGILARLSGKTSRFGHRFDLVADAVCNALAFVSLGVGLHREAAGWWMVALGLIAGVAVVAVLALVLRVERAAGPRAAELPSVARFDADDAMIAVPIAVWLGWSLPLLWLAGTITPLVALAFVWRVRRRLVIAP